MNGRKLSLPARIAAVFYLTVMFLALSAQYSPALPIEPDMGQVARSAKKSPLDLPTARAGWNGPEIPSAVAAEVNPLLESAGPMAMARAVRSTVMSALTPDLRVVVLLAAVILLLRRMRAAREAEVGGLAGASVVSESKVVEMPRAQAELGQSPEARAA